MKTHASFFATITSTFTPQVIGSFLWSLSDNKFSRLSRTLISILVLEVMLFKLYQSLLWFSVFPLTCSGYFFIEFFVRASTEAFMFHFFQLSSKVRKIIQFFSSIYLQCPIDDFFFSFYLKFGLIVWSRLGDPFIYQNPKELRVLFSTIGSSLCIYHLSLLLYTILYSFLFFCYDGFVCIFLLFLFAFFVLFLFLLRFFFLWSLSDRCPALF